MTHEDVPPIESAPPATTRSPHPFLYMLLIVPFGATSAVTGVALTFLATKSGLTVEQGSFLASLSTITNIPKFLWAPLGDKTLTRKRWYVIGCILCAISLTAIAAMPLSPRSYGAMEVLILISGVAATFVGFSVEGMIAHLTPPAERGRVSGWLQAGNLGSATIGGLSLYLIMHFASWQAGAILGALTLACMIPLLWIPDIIETHHNTGDLKASMEDLAANLWEMLKSRKAILCAVLCFVPLGTGAAGTVLANASVAEHWQAHESEVEWIQGAAVGFVSMAGALAGGRLCSTVFNPRLGYVVFGALMAAVTGAMALAPATVNTYIQYSVVYAFVCGLCYAAFSAFVLDAIGTGHAATKYNFFAALSNAPLAFMTWFLGWCATQWGPTRMLWIESLCGVAGIAVFALLSLAVRDRTAPGVAVPGS